MKKIILLTFILLFQSFPSFGNPNGKGLICKCIEGCENRDLINKHRSFYFSKNQVVQHSYGYRENEIQVLDTNFKYILQPRTIIMSIDDKGPFLTLDRQTLQLGVIGNDELKEECNVYDKSEFDIQVKKLFKKFDRFIQETLSKNKI